MVDPVEKSLWKKGSSTTGKGIERAREILDAARQIFATEGYAALTMRSIAARVGVNLSTVQHYYKSKEALLEALLLYMMDAYQTQIDEITHSMAGATRVEQFQAAMNMLLADIRSPMTSGVFIEIWALANRNAFAARIVETIQTRERKAISRLIRELAPATGEKNYELRAALIAAQLEGMMLRIGRKGAPAAEVDQLQAATLRAFLLLATQG